jgi:hypothetical protein
MQRNFYQQHFVILLIVERKISSSFLTDSGTKSLLELLALIRQKTGRSRTEPALSVLPSYTQLGMAALLPNKELALAEDDSGTALVNGMSSQGTANRIKLLQAAHAQSTAMTADALLGLNKEDARALVRDHNVVYIYQNRIDKTGHTVIPKSEHLTPQRGD